VINGANDFLTSSKPRGGALPVDQKTRSSSRTSARNLDMNPADPIEGMQMAQVAANEASLTCMGHFSGQIFRGSHEMVCSSSTVVEGNSRSSSSINADQALVTDTVVTGSGGRYRASPALLMNATWKSMPMLERNEQA